MFARNNTETQSHKMNWKKVNSTTYLAEGEHGHFEIKLSCSHRRRTFWAKYIGYTGKRFCLPPFASLKDAKEACEDSWYWE